MKYIGAHVSAGGGVENAPINANEIGAKAFSFFTKNQRQWMSAPLAADKIAAFKENCVRLGFEMKHVMPHDSYLINLGHPGRDELQKSRMAFIDEMQRCEQLGVIMLNFHPGASLKLVDDETCLKTIAQSINMALESTNGVTAVIENTAGQGSNLGYTFEHLKYIIDLINDKNRVGVCLDTCHTYSAGYDLVTPEGYNETFRLFEEVVGLNYLKGIHLNDTKKALGSHVDRHENIGKGLLGIEVFRRILNDPRFNDLPIILETPEETLWKEEITLLYSLIENR
jgi:deoxyribonuclease IV